MPLSLNRILFIYQYSEPVSVGRAHSKTKKKGMRIFEIRFRSSPKRLRMPCPPPSPSNSPTFSSNIDIQSRQPQRPETDSTASSFTYVFGRSRLRQRAYWETGRGGMNPPQHKNWFASWFRRRALPRTETGPPRTHRAFVVDPQEHTRARRRYQSPFSAVSRAPNGSRARPTSSRINYTFTNSRGRPRSRSWDRDVHEVRGAPRNEDRRSAPAPRVRPISPRQEYSFAGLRGRPRSCSRAPQEVYEVHEAHKTEPNTRHIRFRPPRERTPVIEREPNRSGRWISPVRQGETGRTSPLSDHRSDPSCRFPRPKVRESGVRGTATREGRRAMSSRILSPTTDKGRSRDEPRPRRTVLRSPKSQHDPEVIEERHPRIERPEIIHDGRRGLSERVTHYVGYAPRVRFQESSRFLEPQLTRVFRRRRERHERFTDEQGPLDRWR